MTHLWDNDSCVRIAEGCQPQDSILENKHLKGSPRASWQLYCVSSWIPFWKKEKVLMFVAFSHTRQKAHLLFSVLKSRILQTYSMIVGQCLGWCPEEGELLSISCLSPSPKAKTMSVCAAAGAFGSPWDVLRHHPESYTCKWLRQMFSTSLGYYGCYTPKKKNVNESFCDT